MSNRVDFTAIVDNRAKSVKIAVKKSQKYRVSSDLGVLLFGWIQARRERGGGAGENSHGFKGYKGTKGAI